MDSNIERLDPEPDWLGPRIFLDLAISGRAIGRVTIELAATQCPRTSENFRQLCTGAFRPRGVPVGYRDTPFHRVMPGYLIQGGDCDKRDGTGSMSIYGMTFDDEESAFLFSEPGIVAMANSGPDTNGCQFFITLDADEDLDGRYVTFGRVIDGMFVLRQVESVPLLPDSDIPAMPVTICQSGEL
jgi:peptidyl-prolyl isomerase H (cyclophilin H)